MREQLERLLLHIRRAQYRMRLRWMLLRFAWRARWAGSQPGSPQRRHVMQVQL